MPFTPFARNHLKFWLRNLRSWKTLGYVLSGLGTFLVFEEFVSLLHDAWVQYLKGWYLVIPVIISICSAILIQRPVLRRSAKVKDTDIEIEILVADFFSLDSTYVIPINSSFDLDRFRNPGRGKPSLARYLVETHFEDDIKPLIDQVSPQLPKRLKKAETKTETNETSDRYPLGTVVQVEWGPEKAKRNGYLVATTHLNTSGKSETSLENIKQALPLLWAEISAKGSLETISIPLLGAGHGRIIETREVIIREIVHSFIVAVAKKKRFTNKLKVVISPHDYESEPIDIMKLGRFLESLCENSDLF